MSHWYYVVGTDRVGPITIEALKQLFLNHEITLETYVWKKGFANWERLKDVQELKFDSTGSIEEVHVHAAPVEEISDTTTYHTSSSVHKPVEQAVHQTEVNSPEIKFSFDWKKIKENEDIFFVRIGRDRKLFDGNDIFGPYSLIELKEALEEKRVNYQTLIFTPGMESWTKIQETPLNPNYNSSNDEISLSELPLVLVFTHSPLPLITMIKKAGTRDGVLLGAGPFLEFQNEIVRASLYVGNEIKVKNVQVRIQHYDKKDQTIHCQFIDLDQNATRLMLNHAI